jgi:hypothetical protein
LKIIRPFQLPDKLQVSIGKTNKHLDNRTRCIKQPLRQKGSKNHKALRCKSLLVKLSALVTSWQRILHIPSVSDKLQGSVDEINMHLDNQTRLDQAATMARRLEESRSVWCANPSS